MYYYFVDAHNEGMVLDYCRHQGPELLLHTCQLRLPETSKENQEYHMEIFLDTKPII